MKKIVVLDTETTGLDPKKDRIVELAILYKEESGKDLGYFHQYFNPRKKLRQVIVDLIGVDDAFLKTKPLIGGYLDEIESALQGSTLIAHNASFDVRMLQAEFARHDRVFPQDVEVVDTLEIARRTLVLPSHKLDRLCDLFDVDRSGRIFHGALLDCELLWEVYKPLIALARAEAEKVDHLLGFEGRSCPDSPQDLAWQYLEAHRLSAHFERVKESRADALRRLLGESESMSADEFEIELKAITTTNWKGIVQAQLPGFDTKPFEKEGEGRLSVKFSKPAVETEAPSTDNEPPQDCLKEAA